MHCGESTYFSSYFIREKVQPVKPDEILTNFLFRFIYSQVTTLTRHRGFHKPTDDEQLHVLPHYILAQVDEYGSVEGQRNKVESGAVEILSKYVQQ